MCPVLKCSKRFVLKWVWLASVMQKKEWLCMFAFSKYVNYTRVSLTVWFQYVCAVLCRRFNWIVLLLIVLIWLNAVVGGHNSWPCCLHCICNYLYICFQLEILASQVWWSMVALFEIGFIINKSTIFNLENSLEFGLFLSFRI